MDSNSAATTLRMDLATGVEKLYNLYSHTCHCEFGQWMLRHGWASSTWAHRISESGRPAVYRTYSGGPSSSPAAMATAAAAAAAGRRKRPRLARAQARTWSSRISCSCHACARVKKCRSHFLSESLSLLFSLSGVCHACASVIVKLTRLKAPAHVR